MTEGDTAPRPPFCLDDNCQCWLNPQGLYPDTIKAGYSGICAGKMHKSLDIKFNEVDHINPYCLCFYSPFKGWVRFFLDGGDLESWKICIDRLLKYDKEHPEIQDAINKIYKERESEKRGDGK